MILIIATHQKYITKYASLMVHRIPPNYDVFVISALSILMIKSRRESIHSSMFGVSEMFLRSINNGKKPTNKCHPYTNDNIQVFLVL